MQKLTASVVGMHCNSCSINIKNKLSKEPGVGSVSINYASEKAEIEIDTLKTNIEKLDRALKPLGYSLQEYKKNSLTEIKKKKLLGLIKLKRKVQIVFPLSILVFMVMLWQIISEVLIFIPKFPLSMMQINVILFFASILVLLITGKTFVQAIKIFITSKVANMDTLVGIGTLTAFIYSSLILFFPSVQKFLSQEETYFDVVIVVIGFILLGKYLEDKSKIKTGEAIEKLLSLQAKNALIEKNGKEIEIAVNNLKIGDIVIVKPGSSIPTDGVIINGFSSVDESMINGEPIPTDKYINDFVTGGTLNKQGFLKFRVTKTINENTLSKIVKLVENAQNSRAPIQNMADRVSAIFVPTVLVIAATTLVGWIIFGGIFLGLDNAISLGLVSFVGVLIIACPCALGLATPTAIIVGVGKGANSGILIKNAESLEKMRQVNLIAFDKTGTITKGNPTIVEIINLSTLDDKKILQIAYSMELKSEHPLAKAVIKKGEGENILKLKLQEFNIIEGKGIYSKIANNKYYIGNLKLVNDIKVKATLKEIEKIQAIGQSPLILANEKSILAIFIVADEIKDNIQISIKTIKAKKIQTVMITGDTKSAADPIAKKVGIDKVYAQVLPDEKLNIIKKLQKNNIVAFVGDGINDSPALAQSNVGISLSTGSDIAIESADIILLKGDISKVLEAYNLSEKTISTIKQNLFFAFFYNIIGIPLAAGILYPLFGITLNPVFAGMAMAFSSVSVVSNSLRLKSEKI